MSEASSERRERMILWLREIGICGQAPNDYP